MLPTLNEPPLSTLNEHPLSTLNEPPAVGGEPLIVPPCVPEIPTLSLASAGLFRCALIMLARGAISDGNSECPWLVLVRVSMSAGNFESPGLVGNVFVCDMRHTLSVSITEAVSRMPWGISGCSLCGLGLTAPFSVCLELISCSFQNMGRACSRVSRGCTRGSVLRS